MIINNQKLLIKNDKLSLQNDNNVKNLWNVLSENVWTFFKNKFFINDNSFFIKDLITAHFILNVNIAKKNFNYFYYYL